MEKGILQDKPYLETHRIEELSDEFFKGRVLTIQISQEEIPDYVLAAAKTGFRVKKVAGEGEVFPYWDKDPNSLFSRENRGDQHKSFYSGLVEPQVRVRSIKVLESHIAIAVISPEKAESFVPFWTEIGERRAKQSLSE